MWRRSLSIGALLLAIHAGRAFAAPGGQDSPGAVRVRPMGRPKLPIRIDMGLSGRSTHGAVNCGADTHNPSFAWAYGMVKDGNRYSEPDTWYGDFVEGEDATFLIAVEPPESTYTVSLSLGDPERRRGPVTVSLNDTVIEENIVTEKGQHRDLTGTTGTRNGWIEIHLKADGCDGFALNGLGVSGPEQSWLGILLPGESVDIPEAKDLPAGDPETRRRLLRDVCDYLVTYSPRQGGFSYHGAWYQNAYPIRTLLAGSRILGEPRYSEPAILTLDRFVGKQRADGNWLSTYYGSAACDTAAQADSASANLADIGTIVTCLAVAAPHAGEDRGRRYLEAAKRYAEKISLPNQLADGAFPNGRWFGKHYVFPYTVATATQSSFLAALFEATGDKRYLAAAEKGARWLTSSVHEDGMVTIHPHDSEGTLTKEATDFGDMFYVAEALIAVRAATTRVDLRKEIDMALDHWLLGPQGLRSKTIKGYWFLPQDPWGSSKMAGMVYVLAGRGASQKDPTVSKWLDQVIAWMSDRERARSIGVLEHPAGQRGAYALAATGFAGIGVAASVDPASVRPR